MQAIAKKQQELLAAFHQGVYPSSETSILNLLGACWFSENDAFLYRTLGW
jgi:hypothetical protein